MLRERFPDGGFAAAGHADQYNILHFGRKFFENAVGFAVGNVVPQKQLRGALPLRDEHQKPGICRDPQSLGV